MKSQVSFKFDGNHNIGPVVSILKGQLKNVKYEIEALNKFAYRIYVAAENPKEETFKVCYKIQCFCVYDDTKNLK